MNLFTTYTKEEIKFLKEIVEKERGEVLKVKLFTGLKKEKDFLYFKEKIITKKEILSDFDFVYVKKGKLGVVKDNKIVKILKEKDCFGFLNVFLSEKYLLVALEESDIILFNVNSKEGIENILSCVAEKVKDKILI